MPGRPAIVCLSGIVLILTSCGSRGNRFETPPVEPRDGPAAAVSNVENEDSLAAVDRMFSELDATGDLANAARFHRDDTMPSGVRSSARSSRPRRKTAGPPVLHWQAIEGHASQYDSRIRLPGGVSLGLKARGKTRLGFLNYSGSGVIQTVHLGNLALHMGERLVLGRRGGRFPPTVWSPVSGGLRMAPSLSRWFGQNAAGVSMRWGRWRSQGIAVVRDEEPGSAAALWMSIHHAAAGHNIGIAYGRRLARHQLETRAISSPAVVSLHGSFRHELLGISGEAVRFTGGDTFVAARVTWAGSAKWSLLIYRAPTFSATAKPALDFLPGKSVRRGARLDLRRRLAVGAVTFSLRAGSVGSADERRRFRRTVVEFSHGRRPPSWKVAADWVQQRRRGLTGGVFPDRFERHEQSGRLHGALHLDHGVIAHDLRVYFLPPVAGRGVGVVTSVAASTELGRLQAAWRITAYSLAPGQRSFVTRPGVGSFELFSPVSGKGSDVSARLRLRLGPTLLLFLYYGVPYLKEPRAYVGARIRV